MLSNGFATPINIKPVVSRAYRRLLLAIHALALTAVLFPINLPAWAVIGTLLFILASAVYHFRYLAHACCVIWICHPEGHWQRDGEETNWRLSGVLKESGWFVAFQLTSEIGTRQVLMFFCDQLEPNVFRRLRAYLRFAQVEATRPGETI